MAFDHFPFFDSHLHIIDPRFPLVANNGYLPNAFTCENYLHRLRHYRLFGGAVVSGSFQAFDQSYLVDALERLGSGFVGVTQLPADTTDQRILELDRLGIRALRFNLRRGGSVISIDHLKEMADRVYALTGWHAELYVDAKDLPDLYETVVALPAASIDHLGLSRAGLPTLRRLAEQGIRVKATGFSRVDFAVEPALRDLHSANPASLMFGTDLPSTRAPRPYADYDILRVIDALGETAARRVLYENASQFYRVDSRASP